MNWSEIWNSVSGVCVDLVFKVLASLIVFGIGRALIAVLTKNFPKGSDKHPMDPTTRKFLINITRAVCYIILIVTIVNILGVPLASVLTVLGAAGAAIALALQGSLSNLAAGIMLIAFKPIRLGDYVETNGAGGTVTDLGIFYTTLVTPDNCHYTIPNASLMNSVTKNYSREETRRVDFTFVTDYRTDAEKTKALLMYLVKKQDCVLTDPAPFVRMTDMTDTAITFTIRVWVKSADYWTVKLDLTETVKAAFDEAGISIPVKPLDVHIEE